MKLLNLAPLAKMRSKTYSLTESPTLYSPARMRVYRMANLINDTVRECEHQLWNHSGATLRQNGFGRGG